MKKKSAGPKTAARSPQKSRANKKPDYEPPKLMKFEKLERLIVSGE